MRLLLIISSTIALVFVLTYALLFTGTGNSLLKPLIASKLNATLPLKVELDEFLLRMDRFKIIIRLDKENSFLAEGSYSLFEQSFDIDYLLNLSKLSNLSALAKRELSGELVSRGTVNGNVDLFKVKGHSTLAKSDTNYALIIKQMQVDKAAIKLKDASVQELLSMAGGKAYAKGNIDLHIQLNDLDPKNMQGSVLLDVKKAKLDATVLEKEFGLKILRTALKANLKASLSGSSIEYLLNVDSELASVFSKGEIQSGDLAIDTDYKIDIKELSLLRSITNAPLRGKFSTQGALKGDAKSLKVQGTSDLANSNSTYTILLHDFKPSSVTAHIENAELSELLYLAGQPSYARGELDLNADITSIHPLRAKIKTTVAKGQANAKVIKKAFNLTLPHTDFDLISSASIIENELTAKTKINSNLATLDMKKTTLDIKTSSLKTDYQLEVPSLAKIEPLIEKKLKGSFKAKGEITKGKQLSITAHSDIFNGKLNAKIIDEQVNADFTDLQAIEALKMLGYPQVINAPINGTLAYNTKTRVGKLDSNFNNAVLTRSKMTDLIGSLTNSNLTKERFTQGTLVSKINKDIIDSDLQMRSKKASLKSKKFIIDSKKQLIDARFSLMVKEHPGDVLVTGNINAPKVTLDAKSMITPEIEEKAVKEINRLLRKLF